jgi:chemotaxis protein MotA
MEISTPIGFLVGLVVVYYSISSGIKNALIFMDSHAMIIVIGGTLAATMICLPLRGLVNMFKVFFRTLMGRTQQETVETIREIVRIARETHNGVALEGQLARIKNHFLKESLTLVSQGGLADDEVDEILEKRVEMQNEKYRREGATYKAIGKFPPAFGLVGATLGMIGLLQGLGERDAFERLGPSMSIALVSTFYGLVLANFVLIPVGENLQQASENDLAMRKIVIDGVRLIKEQRHPLLVEEHLKSYLTPFERNKMKAS